MDSSHGSCRGRSGSTHRRVVGTNRLRISVGLSRLLTACLQRSVTIGCAKLILALPPFAVVVLNARPHDPLTAAGGSLLVMMLRRVHRNRSGRLLLLLIPLVRGRLAVAAALGAHAGDIGRRVGAKDLLLGVGHIAAASPAREPRAKVRERRVDRSGRPWRRASASPAGRLYILLGHALAKRARPRCTPRARG